MIPALQAVFPALSLRRRCAILGVSRSWVDDRRGQPAHDAEDLALRDAIERIGLELPGYGYRRVAKARQRDGWTVNHKRVLRVMREEALLCQLQRRFVVTTDSRHEFAGYPNLLLGQAVTGPNQVWVADIPSVRLPTAFVSLACILDAWSRRCVGWELSRLIDTDLTLAALARAIAGRRPAPGLIHHSDHEMQDTSTRDVERLRTIAAQISMAAVGNPYENALAERCFGILKRAEGHLHEDRTFAEAEASLDCFIEEVSNRNSRSSSSTDSTAPPR